jgi:hypothetical protein
VVIIRQSTLSKGRRSYNEYVLKCPTPTNYAHHTSHPTRTHTGTLGSMFAGEELLPKKTDDDEAGSNDDNDNNDDEAAVGSMEEGAGRSFSERSFQDVWYARYGVIWYNINKVPIWHGVVRHMVLNIVQYWLVERH